MPTREWGLRTPKTPRKPKRKDRPLCGAKTRKGTPCVRKAVLGRCRCPNHGGLSTGPKTAGGLAMAAMNLPWVKARRERDDAEMPAH